MLDVFIDNVSGAKMLVSIVERSDIEAPEADYESQYVEGVDGSLNRFLYYKDVEQSIDFNILEDYNIKSQIRKIKAWLLNAKSFYFSDDDVYRKIKKIKIDGIKNDIAEYGEFSVTFTCDPFEYARNDAVVTPKSGSNLSNVGTYKALPLIKIYGSGKGVLTIGTASISVDLQKEYMVLDSQIKEAYFQNTNLGRFMQGEFPVLEPGDTKISWSGGITKIEVERRCRYL